jgi:large subunit ribosomal protein L22
MTVSRAVVRRVRISPRKVRGVVDGIRGKSVPEAYRFLSQVSRRASGIVRKVLKSAEHNALERDGNLDREALVVSSIFVDAGPTLKRFRPRARGSAFSILKRTSHITVELARNAAAPPAAEKKGSEEKA